MRPISLATVWQYFFLVTLASVQGDKYSDEDSVRITRLSLNKYQIEAQMPGLDIKVDDDYLCHSFKITQGFYIESFEAITSDDRVHHLFLYGCDGEMPFYNTTWSCPYMVTVPLCAKGISTSLYVWARNALAFEIPKDVGVAIGASIKGPSYLVLQVHYLLAEKGNVQDYTAIRMIATTVQPDNLALIYQFDYAGDPIPPGIECDYFILFHMSAIPSNAYIFAYMFHAHGIGQVISGYRYNSNSKNNKEPLWTEIGKKNPQWPQIFYPVEEGLIEISSNDILLAQCTYNSSSRTTPTLIGGNYNNEMCAIFIYYYLPANEVEKVTNGVCWDNQFPNLFKSYPHEGSTLLPRDSSLEMSAMQNSKNFGVVEVPNWPDPKLKFGQIGGVAYMRSYKSYQGVLVVFHRSNRIWTETSFDEQFVFNTNEPIRENVVVLLNSADGSIVDSWGAKLFYMPQGAYVDKDNNIWLTDVGSHQVFKFTMTSDSLTFTETLKLGKKLVPGADRHHFCQPAAVVTLGDGSIFVADGYCNSRIVKFNPDGKYLNEWGRPNEAVEMKNGLYPPLGNFHIVEDITADEIRWLLYVADRENSRIQVFNYSSGEFIRQIHPHQFGGAVSGVKYCAETDMIFALNGVSDRSNQPLRVFAVNPDNDGLLYSFAGVSQNFTRPHTLALSSNCLEVFVGEVGPDRLWKFDISFSNRRAKTKPQPNSAYTEDPKSLNSVPTNKDLSGSATPTDRGSKKIGLIVGCAIGIPIGVALLLFGFGQCRRRFASVQQESIPLVGQTAYGATD